MLFIKTIDKTLITTLERVNMSTNIDILNKIKVIYAEDEIKTQILVKSILDRLSYVEIDCVNNGEDLKNKCLQNDYDLIISDIILPKIDGLEVISEIKKIKPNISTIIISAHKNEEYLNKSISIGINSFFQKPLNTNLLISTLTSIYETKLNIARKENYNNKVQKAINVSNIGVFSFNDYQNKLHWDKTMNKIYHSEDLIDLKEWKELIVKSNQDEFCEIFTKLREHDNKTFDKIIKINVNEDIKYIRMTGFYECNSDYCEIVGINEDITELIESKLEILNQKDQLELALLSIKAKNKKIKKAYDLLAKQQKIIQDETKIKAVNDTIKVLSHEWRQPLNLISLTAQTLQFDKKFDTLTDDKFNTNLDLVRETAEDLSDTLEKFTNLVNNQDTPSVEFNLIDAIYKVKDLYERLFTQNSIDFKINFESKKEDYTIKSCESEIKNIFIGLIMNSVESHEKNTKKDKFIGIDLKISKKDLIIDVIDNGDGVKDENMEKIFMPYFSTKYEKSGKGLGLYMIKTSLENKLNGQISAQNCKDYFTVTIKLKGVKID